MIKKAWIHCSLYLNPSIDRESANPAQISNEANVCVKVKITGDHQYLKKIIGACLCSLHTPPTEIHGRGGHSVVRNWRQYCLENFTQMVEKLFFISVVIAKSMVIRFLYRNAEAFWRFMVQHWVYCKLL